MEKNKLPIVMITDDNYLMPTCVTMTSIIVNKEESTEVVFYILMAECAETSEVWLNKFSMQFGCEVNIIRADLSRYKDINQLMHISIAALLKFEIAERMKKYDKMLYIDGDIIVRNDLWELYSQDIIDVYAAGVKEITGVMEDKGRLNSGVVVFNTKKIREENLLPVFLETRKSLGDRNSMDQQTFNIVFAGQYNYLDIKYNCVVGKLFEDAIVACGIDKLNELYESNYSSFQDVFDKAVIVHYATAKKPWIYTFIPEAKEWYSYYMKSPFKEMPFKLRGKWGFRINKYMKILREDGMNGVWASLKKAKNNRAKSVQKEIRIDQDWG